MESEFMKKLHAHKPESTEEHPIIEELKTIPEDKRVNPPPLEECVPDTTEPVEKKEKEKPKRPLQVCPTCDKEFKHLSRHKCKDVISIPNDVVTNEKTGAVVLDATGAVIPKDSSISTVEKHPTTTTTDHSKPPTGMGKVSFGEDVKYVHTETEDDYEPPTVTYSNTIPEGFELLIDCIELNAEGQHLIDFLKPVTDVIEQENKVEHWRMLDYGKDCDILVHKLELYLEYKSPTGVIYLDSSTKEGRACKEVLKKHALRIIQGVR